MDDRRGEKVFRSLKSGSSLAHELKLMIERSLGGRVVNGEHGCGR